MKFAFHSAFDILGHMPSTVISRTELSCWRNSCSYQVMLLLGWNHRYKTSTVVFTIWLTATKYPYYKWQWIFSHIFFTFLSQRQDTRNTNCLSLTSTWVPSRLLTRSMLLIGLVFCAMLCFSVLFVFVQCPVCPMFWCLLIVHYWLSLWFSLTSINNDILKPMWQVMASLLFLFYLFLYTS